MIGQRAAHSRSLHTLWVAASLTLGACATLPVSGPTGHKIQSAAHEVSSDSLQPEFQVVEVTAPALIPPPQILARSMLPAALPRPTDLIGLGDTLGITIYEAGVSLFGKGATRLASSGAGATAIAGPTSADQSASSERLGGVRVDDQGYIRLPFAGRLEAAGRTPAQLQSMIEGRLRGMSQDPQVMVSVEQSISNSVLLAGEVAKPGRLALATNRESLVDAIALAGGYRGNAKDAVARVERSGRNYEIRLSDLLDLPQQDLKVAPGDRITLINRPQSFSVLGAPDKSQEVDFPRARVSLSEAVALAGGVNPNAGDAAAIFVFRYVVQSNGTEQPTVYHFNMMRPDAYLLSQRFVMRDRDVLYISNARANQFSKFVQLLSQLFVPVATARAVTR